MAFITFKTFLATVLHLSLGLSIFMALSFACQSLPLEHFSTPVRVFILLPSSAFAALLIGRWLMSHPEAVLEWLSTAYVETGHSLVIVFFILVDYLQRKISNFNLQGLLLAAAIFTFNLSLFGGFGRNRGIVRYNGRVLVLKLFVSAMELLYEGKYVGTFIILVPVVYGWSIYSHGQFPYLMVPLLPH